jgi:hypothetical protein
VDERRESGGNEVDGDGRIKMNVKTLSNEAARLPENGNKPGCTQPYSMTDVQSTIKALRGANKSYRQIAKEHFGGQINHAVVQRILAGEEPKDPKIRRAVGLADYHQVVVVAGGDVPPGTLVISASLCECGQWFISNHPRRKRCFICSPYRKQGGSQ